MGNLSSVVLVGTFAVLIGPALAEDTNKAVSAAYSNWDAAFNKADPKAVGAAYASEALLLPPSHEVLEGQPGAEKFFSGLFSSGVTSHKLELIRATESGDLVVATARWSVKAKDKTAAGLATHVFRKQPDGSLKLILHTFN
jgi:ketosteroid isomerase-like protein